MSARLAASPRMVAITFGLLTLQAIDSVFGSGCAPDNPDIAISTSSAFNITSSTFSPSELGTAVAYWSGCGGGTDSPSLQVGGSGGVPVSVTRVAGSSPTGRCGRADVHIGATSHRVVAVDITIYTHQNNGSTCNPLTDEIAHELGHALGLADADSSACRQHIMGFRDSGTTRSVGAEDCDQVDQNWALPGEPTSGGGAGGGGTPCV